MDFIGISGLAISLAGFTLSLWQIRKTRTAAEAAKIAADEAVAAMRVVHSIASIQEICGRSRDLLHLTRAGNSVSAANAAFELLDLVARFQATDAGRRMTTAETWNLILRDASALHANLESAALRKKSKETELETLLHAISKLHAQLSSLAASAADTGAHHEHSD